jgi:hypothetical protein
MNSDEALQLAKSLLDHKVDCVPAQELWSLDDSKPPRAAIVVTEEIPFDEALEFYRATKARREGSKLSPLILREEAFESLFASGASSEFDSYPIEGGHSFFDVRARKSETDVTKSIEASLNQLERLFARDALQILHRIPLGELAELENLESPGDASELDDLLLPDDLKQAYAEELARRQAFLAEVRAKAKASNPSGMSQLVLEEPLRTFDEATALEQIPSGGQARLALVASTPAEALRHLGFCIGASPLQHSWVWEYWKQSVDAEPVVIDQARIEGVVLSPPSNRSELVQFVREIVLYDPDAAIEGWLSLLGMVYRNTSIGFWWD